MTQTKTVKPARPSGRAGLPCSDSSASFWHSQPNPFLLGHRTTDELPSKADIVIVGSGITGASIAYFLASHALFSEKSVIMLDAREVCWGATGRNGGHCQPLLFDRTSEIAAFEVENVKTVKTIIDKHDIKCEWRDVSGCRTFWDEKLFAEAQSAVAKLAVENPNMGKLVSIVKDKADYAQHRVRPDCVGMTLTQGAGQLWPYKYVTAIVESLVRGGKLNVQTNTPVLEIDGHVLKTTRGTIEASNIILATNGYTSHLLEEFQSLIVPVRCEMSALHPTDSTRLPNSYGMVGFGGGNPEHDDYLIQRPFYDGKAGQLMFGGGRAAATYDCVGETDDDIVDVGEAEYLRRSLPKMLTIEGEELRASHQWTGIKGFSRDDNPWVGRVRDGVWLCAGYTGHGMPNATLCGKAIVDMLAGAKSKIPDCYHITDDRVAAAHKMATVEEQDASY